MAISPNDVLEALQKGEYAPIYFLQGEEPYFIDEISNFIENNALDDSQRSFNQIILYGKDVDISDILLNAKRFPMMSDRQVVIVKEAQEIRDLRNDEGRKSLDEYILNPLPSTILVFCHKYKKVDKRTGLGKNLQKHTVFVDTKKLYENQVAAWTEQFAKSLGLKIAQDAGLLITAHLGNNLERIAKELEKIKTNLKESGEIDLRIVQKYIGINKDYNVFEYSKALMTQDVTKAHRIVNYFEANIKNNSIIPIIALVYTNFSKLLVFHGNKGKSDKSLTDALKINPYFLKEYKIGASNYPLQKVIANLKFISKADLLAKGIERPSIGDGQILRDLTFQLMH